MGPEDLVELPEPALAFHLPHPQRTTVLGDPDAYQHGHLEAPLGDGELEGVGVSPFHVRDVDRLPTAIHDHGDVVLGLQGVVQ